MGIDMQELKREVQRIVPSVTDMRRHLHAHPETALTEQATAAFIRKRLGEAEIDTLPPLLATDVVALLRGTGEGPNVTLRADIDALPLREATGLPHQSLADGVMHACGHDGHTAMLIGAALVLNRLKGEFSGSVRCVFQPGEENVAAGRDLVAAGVLRDPKPGAVIALHCWPGYPVGTIISRPGPMMAAADIFTLTVRGKGGHGSRPECAVDPILTATKVIGALYDLPSRRIGALEPVVITVCAIQGGANANVIPEEVVLQGSVRYLSREVGGLLPTMFEDTVQGVCELAGASYQLDYRRPYPPTLNDGGVVEACRNMLAAYPEAGSWCELPQPSMGAEDFAYYLEQHPGAMFFLGMGEESPQLHSNCFDFNDEALEQGILFLVSATLELLKRAR